ncbi:MazG nucleotide pyrophosphohydrolase domain-containing protein [Nesterenkonia aerolata]|uniref:MazG nucleotide pyrophosphohydrolase domain-containing protein n=1 Tax=Nesterenkonia aerolata TaxID=3074079 RepID=A0ABU2DR80_9MICC|nr:MazG nucleotide pyrophosphohydrolase domain-containing protein [Nesterenkonia sp. LY-0111]MDR8018820.1 MazG nucleotide pyrophosphohydrolase domain-containing protein [Nesterenkonia sp. LY-0111]
MSAEPEAGAVPAAEPSLPHMVRLVQVIAELREHCLWTADLTHEALSRYLIEEAQETVEEIEAGPVGDPVREDRFRTELGDVLLQVVLHAQLAAERGAFDLDAVAEAITAKLIRRNPHVYAEDGTLDPQPATREEIEAAWARIKQQEKS